MQPSSDPFSNEINVYEERLRSNPASYCFAALAELYLKAGQADDALSVARAGVARYPAFVAGQMALARVCQQQGLSDEALQALAVVTTAVPESAEAQRMRAQFCLAAGRQAEAMQALRTVLEFNPDDQGLQTELAELEQAVWDVPAAEEDDLELIELSDEDLLPDFPEEDLVDELVVRSVSPVVRKTDPWAISGDTENAPAAALFGQEQPVAAAADPMVTATVAELYLSQGFTEKALDIYRTLVARDPADAAAAARLTELEQQQSMEAAAAAVAAAPQVTLPVAGTADQGVVTVLEGWLENIRRLRACR